MISKNMSVASDISAATTKSAGSSAGGSTRSSKARKEKKELDQALLNACYFGNTYGAKKFLRDGADPAYSEERDGWSAIHYAGRWGDCEMLLALLAYDADVNLRTTGKETALHKATRWDQKDVAILLMKKGALPHFKNGDGKTASDMTPDTDLKFLVDHFDDWVVAEEQRKIRMEEEERILKAARDKEAAEIAEERAAEEAKRRARYEFRMKNLYGSKGAPQHKTTASSPSSSRRK